MAQSRPGSRKPATKFANLRKKMAQAKLPATKLPRGKSRRSAP